MSTVIAPVNFTVCAAVDISAAVAVALWAAVDNANSRCGAVTFVTAT